MPGTVGRMSTEPERGLLPIARRGDLALQGVPAAAVRRDIRAGRLVRAHRGVYRTQTDHAFAQLMAAHVHLGAEAVACLTSAAALHGVEGIVGDPVPEFALPPGTERAQREGIRLHFWDLPEDDVIVIHGIPTTSIHATLADLARLLPRQQAVACLDSALHQGLITLPELNDLGSRMRRRPHAVAGRRRLAEAQLGAQSPLETRVRLRAVDGGFPPDELQVPIRDDAGQLLGYADAGYRLPGGGWLLVEADGRTIHEAPTALLHDRHRQNALLAQPDTSMVRFTWADTQSPGYIPSVLRPILTRHGWRPPRRP